MKKTKINLRDGKEFEFETASYLYNVVYSENNSPITDYLNKEFLYKFFSNDNSNFVLFIDEINDTGISFCCRKEEIVSITVTDE